MNNNPGIQTWSRGPIFPATIVLFGNGDAQAQCGTRKGPRRKQIRTFSCLHAMCELDAQKLLKR